MKFKDIAGIIGVSLLTLLFVVIVMVGGMAALDDHPCLIFLLH